MPSNSYRIKNFQVNVMENIFWPTILRLHQPYVDWLILIVLQQMLENNKSEDLCQSLSLVFSIFHMDLEHMTLSLLLHTLPRILHTKTRLHLMIDPRGYTLAKLCVLCIDLQATWMSERTTLVTC